MKHGDKILARDIMSQVKKNTLETIFNLLKLTDLILPNNLLSFVFCQTLESIKRKQVEKYHKAPQGKKEEIECNPYTIFHQALDNCKPVVGLASVQKGGKYYQVSVR